MNQHTGTYASSIVLPAYEVLWLGFDMQPFVQCELMLAGERFTTNIALIWRQPRMLVQMRPATFHNIDTKFRKDQRFDVIFHVSFAF